MEAVDGNEGGRDGGHEDEDVGVGMDARHGDGDLMERYVLRSRIAMERYEDKEKMSPAKTYPLKISFVTNRRMV